MTTEQQHKFRHAFVKLCAEYGIPASYIYVVHENGSSVYFGGSVPDLNNAPKLVSIGQSIFDFIDARAEEIVSLTSPKTKQHD